MKEKAYREKTQQPQVVTFENRKQVIVTCPHCWTEQRSDRDFCYRCGALFQYRDECRKSAG